HAEAIEQGVGMGQVHSLEQFIEALKLLHVTGPTVSNSIATISCSGGEAALAADAGHRHALLFPATSSQQNERLSTVLGPLVTPSNPLDYHTQIWRDEEALANTITTMMDGPQTLTILILDFPRSDRCSQADWDHAIAACLAARNRTGGNLAVASSLAESLPEDVAERLLSEGIVPFHGLEDACAAIRCASGISEPVETNPILISATPRAPTMVSEADAKAELHLFGVPVPKSVRCDNASQAAIAAGEIGFPVVLKGEGFAHKSEHGAVVLDLASVTEVEAAADRMGAKGYLVEQQITDAVLRLIVGIVRDEAHGFVLTVGAGGTLTELLRDRASLLVPASRAAVIEALDSLKISPLLDGYRGAPAVSREPVIAAIMALQDYACAKADKLSEVEVNPLICGSDFAIAADALISKEADDA
ncbi:MAG: acetate--CoA ligase family protein, partial [Pseudomonadota bacterium]